MICLIFQNKKYVSKLKCNFRLLCSHLSTKGIPSHIVPSLQIQGKIQGEEKTVPIVLFSVVLADANLCHIPPRNCLKLQSNQG